MIKKDKKLTRTQFYLYSFTWGIVMSLIGCIISIYLICRGYKPKSNGYGWYFEKGQGNSGSEFGCMYVIHENSSQYLRDHEFGHTIQNCYYGPGMIFITLASAIRFHYRNYLTNKKHITNLPPYDSVWFEGEATKLGEYYRTH